MAAPPIHDASGLPLRESTVGSSAGLLSEREREIEAIAPAPEGWPPWPRMPGLRDKWAARPTPSVSRWAARPLLPDSGPLHTGLTAPPPRRSVSAGSPRAGGLKGWRNEKIPPDYGRVPYTDGTVKYVLRVTAAQELCASGKCYWTAAYFAPNGTCEASTSTIGCVAPGKTTPADATGSVTSISMPATYNPSGYFSCLDFSYTVNGPGYLIFLLSSPASPGTWVQNNIANCAPGPGITPLRASA
jgi:hypothetical protein